MAKYKGIEMEVLFCWCICNNAILNVYDIEYGVEDRLLVGINNDNPKYHKTYINKDGEIYIIFGGSKYYLNECILFE